MGVYAASKAAQEVLALEAHRTGGVRVIAARPFNHSGPGHSPSFVIPALVKRAVALRGTAKPLVMGNTDTVRDFSHVEDVVRAYVALAERGAPGEAYNIASGSGTSVQDVNKLLKQFQEMSRMMKQVSKLGKKGLMRSGFLAPRGLPPGVPRH